MSPVLYLQRRTRHEIKYFLLPAGAALACCSLALAVNRKTAMSCTPKPSTGSTAVELPQRGRQHAPATDSRDFQDPPFDPLRWNLTFWPRLGKTSDPELLPTAGCKLRGERRAAAPAQGRCQRSVCWQMAVKAART